MVTAELRKLQSDSGGRPEKATIAHLRGRRAYVQGASLKACWPVYRRVFDPRSARIETAGFGNLKR